MVEWRSMIGDRELWACAVQVLRQHGQDAPAFIAGRIEALALRGDEQGVATWKGIAARLDAIRGDQTPH